MTSSTGSRMNWKIKHWAKCLLTIVVLATSHSISAQEVKSLNLAEAIQLSLKNSHQLHASAARVQQAIARTQQAENNQLPNAEVSGAYMRLTNPALSLKTGKPAQGPDTSSVSTPKVNSIMYGMANVSLPIYTGGKIRYGIESARLLEKAAQLDIASDSQQVIATTIDAYTNLYKANATVDIVRQNLLQSRHQDSLLQRLESTGLLARNDLLKSELQTSRIELSLMDAESNTRLAMINMNLLIGLAENTILKTDSTGFAIPSQTLLLTDLQQGSMQNRYDYKALLERKEAVSKAILLAKADLYPDIALTGGYLAGSIPHLFSVYNAINIGLGVKYNLASLWKSKAKIKEARSKADEMNANEAALSDKIHFQIDKSYEAFLVQQKKISVYQKAIGQAEENYRITKNKFDNQLVNTQELLDANVLLLQSRINLALAKADLYLAYNQLLLNAGILSK